MAMRVSELIAHMQQVLQQDGDVVVTVRLPSGDVEPVGSVNPDVKYGDPADHVIIRLQLEHD